MSFARAQLDQIRSFNRVVTRRIGVLDDHYLGRNRPVGQDRMLWEIGVDGSEVRALRARLGLDAGHTSRLLRALEAANLVAVESSERDGRVRIARPPADRAELIAAMRTVKRLLTTSEIDIRRVDPAGTDAQRCIAAYVAELN